MFGRRKSAHPDDGAVPAAAKSAPGASVAPGSGPHDRSEVSDVEAYFSEVGFGYMDLGAMVVGIPQGRELNVTLSPAGVPEFHVLSPVARVVPRAYSAPRSAGQWRSWIADMRSTLEEQGAEVSVVDGPWGRELSAEMPGAVFRAVGVDRTRWMAEVQIMSTPENAEAAAEEGREVLRHLVVDRGRGPMPVREPLPLVVPDEVHQALLQAQTQAQEQMVEQQRQQAYAQQMAAAQGQQAAAPQAPEKQDSGHADGPRRSGSAMDSLRDDDI